MAVLAPEMTACVGSLSLLACLALRGLRGQLLGRFLADAQQRRHGTLADRHCRLHSPPARLQETSSIGHADGAGCGKR